MKCYICDKKFSKWAGLATHIRRVHSYNSEDYYNEFISSQEKYCLYCGIPNCKFRSIRDGYSKFCNKECDNLYRKTYGWNDETKSKISDGIQKRFESEEERNKISRSIKKLWDKGIYSKAHISSLGKNRIVDDEERIIKADICRENFKGKEKTETHKQRISSSLKGRKQSEKTIEKRRLKQIGRKQPQSFIRKISRDNNPNWKGGYRKNYGNNWLFLREEIVYEYDECTVCGINREDHLKRYQRDLSVHHIIKRNKFNDVNLSNFRRNLIPLCNRCHGIIDNQSIFNIENDHQDPYIEFLRRLDLYIENQVNLLESLYDELGIDHNKILLDELDKGDKYDGK